MFLSLQVENCLGKLLCVESTSSCLLNAKLCRLSPKKRPKALKRLKLSLYRRPHLATPNITPFRSSLAASARKLFAKRNRSLEKGLQKRKLHSLDIEWEIDDIDTVPCHTVIHQVETVIFRFVEKFDCG